MGDLNIEGAQAGQSASSLFNYAGRIEAQGDITIAADTVTNRAVLPSVNQRGYVEHIQDGGNIITRSTDTFNADGKKAEILSGKTLSIKAQTVNNDYGTLSAWHQVKIDAHTLNNTSYGAIQTENMVAKAACYSCHQTVRYSGGWGGLIESGGAADLKAIVLNNKTTDTRDGFAGLSDHANVVIVDERSGTQSPLTKAFVDRFGIVKDASATATSNQPGQLPSARLLSDNLVLTAYGQFDFSRFKLPDGQTGLFETAPAASPYLIRGRTDLVPLEAGTQNTVYNKFLGSDYLMTRLGLLPGVAKRLGDAWYETQLVQEQLYAMTGRKYIVAGTSSDYDLMKGLMDAGVLAQAQLGLAAGQALSEQQQAALTQDMVWSEWQEVDGQRVLVPKVYLAHQDQEPLHAPTGVGALIVGREVSITAQDLSQEGGAIQAQTLLSINASGKVSGSGNYSGGTSVAIVASSVDLKNASVQSAGWLQLETTQGDLNLTATQISAAGNATVKSAGELNLLAQKHEAHVVRADGSAKGVVKFETTNITAGGNLTLQSAKDLTVQGSSLSAGQDLKVESSGGSVDLQALKTTEDTRLNATTSHQEQVQGVQLTSGGNTQVQALGNVTAQSLQLSAGGDAALGAAGAVSITSAQAYSSTQTGSDKKQSLQTERSQIEAGGNVTIYGQQAVQLSATDVNAGGKALVQSQGDIELGYNTDTEQHNWTTSSTKRSYGGVKKKTTTTQHETADKTAEVNQINADQVQVLGNNVTSYGANLNGQNLVQVEGADKTALYAVNEEHLSKADSKTSSSFIGINYSKSTSSDSSLDTTALGTKLTSEEAIKLGVGTVTDVRGAIMTAPKIDIVRSEGADTSKDGELILGTSSNTTETSHTESTTTAGVWKAESGHGSTTETANQTQINGQLNIANGINTTVQIPEGNLKDQVAALSQQPGLEYLKDLANDPKIKWEQVKLAHDEWQYDQQGLTPAGAALLSIAVAVASGGAAAGFVHSLGFTGATAAGMTAGMTAMASSAAVSFVNNGGDIGKTLKDLGSKDSIKNIALAMVTAGVLTELNTAMGLDKVTVKDGFTANLGKAVVNNLANAGVTSAITGTSLEDNIKTGLVSAFISAGAGQAANEIGKMTIPGLDGQPPTLNAAGQALAHALAGCMDGGATGGRQGCESGAIGAVVGELAGKWYDSDGSKTDAQILEFVKVIAAAAGAVTGDGSAASVSTAVMTAVNAVQNNLLATRDVKKLMEQLGQCSGSQCDAIKRLYTGLMQTSTGGLEGLCKANPQACAGQLPDYVQALKEMQTPEFKALVGDETANRLIDRQVADLNKVVSALNWGNEHAESSKQIVKAAMLVGATAAGGGLMLAVGRAVVAACGSGVLTPACTGLITELGVGVAEAASGVPTLGVGVPVAAAVTTKLKQIAETTNDATTIAKELQAVVAEAKTGAFSAGTNWSVNPTHLNELIANGVKFTPENVIATARSPSGQVVFLEIGTEDAGLKHIVKEHVTDFANVGISETQIPSVLMRAVSEGNIVGYQGRGTGRPIYKVMINGQPQRFAITTGKNGFIVGANPAGRAP
jgi:adhesin HecA-like repeat protein